MPLAANAAVALDLSSLLDGAPPNRDGRAGAPVQLRRMAPNGIKARCMRSVRHRRIRNCTREGGAMRRLLAGTLGLSLGLITARAVAGELPASPPAPRTIATSSPATPAVTLGRPV